MTMWSEILSSNEKKNCKISLMPKEKNFPLSSHNRNKYTVQISFYIIRRQDGISSSKSLKRRYKREKEMLFY